MMTGGGRPAGGSHRRTRDTPSCTKIGAMFSFDHKGDPAGQKRQAVEYGAMNIINSKATGPGTARNREREPVKLS